MPHVPGQAQRQAMMQVAAESGDRVIDTAPFVGPDRLHPTAAGDHRIAAQIREATQRKTSTRT